MNITLIEKLQKKSKEMGIYLIRRLDSNLKSEPHSYCVSFLKRTDRTFVDAVKAFDDCLRLCIPEDGKIEYVDRMIVVHMDNNDYYFCLEAYKKNADSRGYMENDQPQMELLYRMSVEQAIYRLKKYSWQSWKQKRLHYSYQQAIDEIKGQMSDSWFEEKYPNHADRFIAIYYYLKERMKYKPGYIKGVL